MQLCATAPGVQQQTENRTDRVEPINVIKKRSKREFSIAKVVYCGSSEQRRVSDTLETLGDESFRGRNVESDYSKRVEGDTSNK